MSGQYLDPEPYTPPHQCDRPGFRQHDVAIGTRWQCECGQIWRAEPLNAYGKRGEPHWVKRPSFLQ